MLKVLLDMLPLRYAAVASLLRSCRASSIGIVFFFSFSFVFFELDCAAMG
jgi:hypothetical protein